MTRSIAKQATKYTDAFGPGAMVFSGGVMCDARVLPEGASAEPPLMLDGSHVTVGQPPGASAAATESWKKQTAPLGRQR
jgi:hypothetical protein